MGYIIQSVELFPHMTIRENIQIIAKEELKNKKILEERTKELMDLIGLDLEMLERYPGELSGVHQ